MSVQRIFLVSSKGKGGLLIWRGECTVSKWKFLIRYGNWNSERCTTIPKVTRGPRPEWNPDILLSGSSYGSQQRGWWQLVFLALLITQTPSTKEHIRESQGLSLFSVTQSCGTASIVWWHWNPGGDCGITTLPPTPIVPRIIPLALLLGTVLVLISKATSWGQEGSASTELQPSRFILVKIWSWLINSFVVKVYSKCLFGEPGR